MSASISLQAPSRQRLIIAGFLLATGISFMLLIAASSANPASRVPVVAVTVLWFALVALLVPETALVLYAVIAATTMGYEFLIVRGNSVSGGIFLSQVLLAVLALAWLVRCAVRRGAGEARAPLPMLLPLVGLAVVPVVSIVGAYVVWEAHIPTLHRKLVVQAAGASLILLSVAATLLAATIIRKVAQVKIIVGIIIALAALAFLDAFGLARTPGLALVYMAAPVAFSFALHARSAGRRLLWLSLLVPPLVMSITTIKVTLMVAILVPVLFISFMHSRRALAFTLAGLLVLYLAVGVAIGQSPYAKVYAKAVMVKDFDRIPLFLKAIEIAKTHPALGVGPGGQFAYLDGENYYGTSHSLYGNFLIENGIVGTGLLLWVIAAGVALGIRTYRAIPPLAPGRREAADDSFVRAFVLGQTGGFVGMAVAGLFSDTMLPAVQNAGLYIFGSSVYLWLMLGMVAALRRMQLEGKIATADTERLHTELEHARASA